MKSNLRMRLLVSIAAIFAAATSLRAESPLLSGSVTLPSPTRWGSLVLASGTYQFTLNHQGLGGLFTVKQGSTGVGVMPVDTVSLDSSLTSSSMLITGNRVQSLYLVPVGTIYHFRIRAVEKETVSSKSDLQTVALAVSKSN